MSITIDTVLSAVAAIAIVSFCFWKPNFPQNILPKIGVQNDKIVGFFPGVLLDKHTCDNLLPHDDDLAIIVLGKSFSKILQSLRE